MPLPIPFIPLPREFYERSASLVAKRLLGKALVRREGEVVTGGIIVETEAYLSANDPACHASRGPMPKNRTMFGPAGHLYVYAIHAKYCMNAVTEKEGAGSAVLIRAIEPLWGTEAMALRRKSSLPRDWTRGPARLCQALRVERPLDGHDLTVGSEVWIAAMDLPTKFSVRCGPRIGISQAVELPLRFFLDGNPFVSGRVGDHTSRPGPSGVVFPGNCGDNDVS